MNTQAGQGFIQLLPNINQDNKELLRNKKNKQNKRVTKLSDKAHKDSNEIDTHQDAHQGIHHDQNAINVFPELN
jgi:hypothetical protein